MNLFEKFLKAIDYRVSSGSDYMWDTWKNGRYFNCETTHGYATVIADAARGIVYEITTYSDRSASKPGPYRWLNPDFSGCYRSECNLRRINFHTAWGDVNWIDTESAEDILDKVYAIVNNLEFDQNVVMMLDVDHLTLNRLALGAHERKMTLNDFICQILLEKVRNFNTDTQ